MKKLSVLFLVFVSLSFVSCKSKKNTTKGVSKKAVASIKSELGEQPPVIVSANISAMKKSMLWDLTKKAVKKEAGDVFNKVSIDKLDKAILLAGGDFGSKAEKVKNANAYIVIKGISVDEIKKLKPEKFKSAKLNGKDVVSSTKDGVTTYVFSPSKNITVAVAGDWSKKVTPGKGALGTGSLVNNVGSEALTFNINGIPKLKKAKGTLNLSSGLKFNGEFTVGAKMVDKTMKEYAKAKKQADQIPMPGIKDLINAVTVKKIGSDTLSVKVDLSEKQLKNVMNLAKTFGQGMM